MDSNTTRNPFPAYDHGHRIQPSGPRRKRPQSLSFEESPSKRTEPMKAPTPSPLSECGFGHVAGSPPSSPPLATTILGFPGTEPLEAPTPSPLSSPGLDHAAPALPSTAPLPATLPKLPPSLVATKSVYVEFVVLLPALSTDLPPLLPPCYGALAQRRVEAQDVVRERETARIRRQGWPNETEKIVFCEINWGASSRDEKLEELSPRSLGEFAAVKASGLRSCDESLNPGSLGGFRQVAPRSERNQAVDVDVELDGLVGLIERQVKDGEKEREEKRVQEAKIQELKIAMERVAREALALQQNARDESYETREPHDARTRTVGDDISG